MCRNSHMVLLRISFKPALYELQTVLKEPYTPFRGPPIHGRSPVALLLGLAAITVNATKYGPLGNETIDLNMK